MSRAWTSASSKNKPTPAERAALARLAKVRSQRQAFEGLSRHIIAETLARYVPDDGQIVEIGTGDGQLFERLPAAVLPRVLHTEPQAAVARAFQKLHPEVAFARASAEHLPLEAGAAAAVLASCVMDVVPDGPAVARELGRVLRPGGTFIHWLDMSTVLEPVVSMLSESDLVPLPNVFAEPAEGEWPEDLFLVRRGHLALVATILRDNGHALWRPLTQYLAIFSASPVDVGRAVAELAQLQDDSALRSAVRAAFKAAYELAPPDLQAQLGQFQGRPVSSARLFEQRLCGWFGAEAGFRVEHSAIVRACESAPRGDSSLVYRSCFVGEQRGLRYVPDTLLCPEPVAIDDGQVLLELGMFVFVARRI